MKHLVAAAFAGLTFTAHAEVLETPSFLVRIDVHCAEGNVTCEDVTYTGTSRKTGKSISLKGRTKHSKCVDGVTPCAFQGYIFQNGTVTYLVLSDGELVVVKDNKTLLREQGTWK